MRNPCCEQCRKRLERSAAGIYYCPHCGLAYSYQWSMPDGVHCETVTCRYPLPDETEYRRRLAVLEARKSKITGELAGGGGLRGFWKKKKLRTELSLLQKQIRVIKAHLLNRQTG